MRLRGRARAVSACAGLIWRCERFDERVRFRADLVRFVRCKRVAGEGGDVGCGRGSGQARRQRRVGSGRVSQAGGANGCLSTAAVVKAAAANAAAIAVAKAAGINTRIRAAQQRAAKAAQAWARCARAVRRRRRRAQVTGAAPTCLERRASGDGGPAGKRAAHCQGRVQHVHTRTHSAQQAGRSWQTTQATTVRRAEENTAAPRGARVRSAAELPRLRVLIERVGNEVVVR